MIIRVGINGMGRIGRDYLRYALDHEDLEVAALNDITDVTSMARLLRHDSTFGPLRHHVEIDGSTLIIDGRKVAVTAVKDRQNCTGASTASRSSSRQPEDSAPASRPNRT